MFICNVKVNGKLWFKIIMIVMALVVLAIFTLSIYKLYLAQNEEIRINDELRHSNVTEILPKDYTNIIKYIKAKNLIIFAYFWGKFEYATFYILNRNLIKVAFIK